MPDNFKDASVTVHIPKAEVEGAMAAVFADNDRFLARVAESDADTMLPVYAEPAFERPDVTEAKARLREAVLYYEKTPMRSGQPRDWAVIRLADLRIILIAANVDLPPEKST